MSTLNHIINLLTHPSQLGGIVSNHQLSLITQKGQAHRSPLGAASSISCLNSFKSSSLNSTSLPPTFSFNRSGFLVPGIGIAPWAMTHATASWPGVHPFLSAIALNSRTRRRLAGRYSGWKRGMDLRRSLGGSLSRFSMLVIRSSSVWG